MTGLNILMGSAGKIKSALILVFVPSSDVADR